MVFFTPCGEPFTQHVAERLLKSERLLFVCSRYEGVDERAYAYADERLSIGDYVLTGGELPAMVVADAVVRLIPGALGDEMSNVDESFSTAEDGGLLEYAQYTRPAEFNGEGVPPVLVSGDHAKSMPGVAKTPSSVPVVGVPILSRRHALRPRSARTRRRSWTLRIRRARSENGPIAAFC